MPSIKKEHLLVIGSRDPMPPIEQMTALIMFLGYVLLVGVVCFFIPMLFTGTAPVSPEGDLPIGTNTILREVPPVVIDDFWPLSLTVWFAFSPKIRLVTTIVILASVIVSSFMKPENKQLFRWGLVAALGATMVLNMVAVFYIF